jgi:hypothetical protein
MDCVLCVGVRSEGESTELGVTEDSVRLDSLESSEVLIGSESVRVGVGDGGTGANGRPSLTSLIDADASDGETDGGSGGTDASDGETEGGNGIFSGWTLMGEEGIVGTSDGTLILSLSGSSIVSSRGSGESGASEGMLPYSVGACSIVENVVEATSAIENSVGAFPGAE